MPVKKIGTALLCLMSLSACDDGFEPSRLSVRESESKFALTSSTTDLASLDLAVGSVGGSAQVCLGYTAGSDVRRIGSRKIGKIVLVSQEKPNKPYLSLPDGNDDAYAKTVCWDPVETGKYVVKLESGTLDGIISAFGTETVSIRPQVLWARLGEKESTVFLDNSPLPVVAAYPYVRSAYEGQECLQLLSYSPYGTQSIPSRFIVGLVTAQTEKYAGVMLKDMEIGWRASGDISYSVASLPYNSFVESVHGAVVPLENMWQHSSVTTTTDSGVFVGVAANSVRRFLAAGKPLCLGTAFNTLGFGKESWCLRNNLTQLTWEDPRTGSVYSASSDGLPVAGPELCTQ